MRIKYFAGLSSTACFQYPFLHLGEDEEETGQSKVACTWQSQQFRPWTTTLLHFQLTDRARNNFNLINGNL